MCPKEVDNIKKMYSLVPKITPEKLEKCSYNPACKAFNLNLLLEDNSC